MTVHIEGVHLAILVIACLVGYAVHRRSSGQPAGAGGPAEAIMVAAAVVTALVLLFTGAETGPPEVPPPPAGPSLPSPGAPSAPPGP
ncbi:MULTISPECIES: hypothetical protein [unclassified Streptomyces]|uniref:hypothetical protein n=1 Tax=unclassified Streptomyces TaxID=2593676 RepID=UPI0022370AD7|nr:hypothetical protein [Streptomyces sp. SHP 1-2]MCW5251378.1 hypothetical protein [Streptomyces sp. SHP 1-2]